MNSKTHIVTVCALIAFAAAAHANNLLVNGGFENPVIPVNTYQKLSTLPGWSTTNAGGLFEVWSGSFGAIPATEGAQHLEINASLNDQTVLQTVSVAQGVLTTFSFDYTGRETDNTFMIDVTGDTSHTSYVHITLDPLSYYSSHLWDTFSTDFTPTDSALTITFRGAPTPPLDAGAHIDNVSLTQVPEPSSMALFLATACVFIPAFRRRWLPDAT